MPDPNNIQQVASGGGYPMFHSVWMAFLTLFGMILAWNGNRFVKELDQKAEVKDLDEHKENIRHQFDAMQTTINRMLDDQKNQHRDNTDRLDKILHEVYRKAP